MLITSLTDIQLFIQKHPYSEKYLATWLKIFKNSSWSSFEELRITYPNTEIKGRNITFRLGQNKYLLKCYIDFESNLITIRTIEINAGKNGRYK